jgi:hypothetical protein
MGTKAIMNFLDGKDKIQLYRGHDSFPDVVEKEIKKAIKDFYPENEPFLLASRFLGINFEKKSIWGNYEIKPAGIGGGEEYTYNIWWDSKDKVYKFETIDNYS